jgi:hypothetical protein
VFTKLLPGSALIKSVIIIIIIIINKVKLFLEQAVKVYRIEMSRLPHFLGNRLRDGGKFVSLTRLPPFTPTKIPVTHFR